MLMSHSIIAHAHLALHNWLIDLGVMPDRDDLHSRAQVTVRPAPGRHDTWAVTVFTSHQTIACVSSQS